METLEKAREDLAEAKQETLEESLAEANAKMEEVIKLSEEINKELKKIQENYL